MTVAMLAGGLQLGYLERGDGYPVLLLGPAGFDHSIFVRGGQVAALSKRFRTIAVDLRGTGISSKPTYSYHVEDLAKDVCLLMDYLELDRGHVLACSFGSLVALELAVRYPERVSALICLNPWARTDEYLRRMFEIWHYLYSKSGPDVFGKATLWWLLSEDFVNKRPEALDQLARAVFAAAGAPPRETYLHQLRISTEHDAVRSLLELAIPTLVIGGEADRAIPARYAREVAELVPRCQYRELTGSGSSHLLLLERAREVNDVVLQFLEEISRPQVPARGGL